jgi:hypothetical protein
MREEYGYAVAVSTGAGRKIVDLEKCEFGFIISLVSKARRGHPDFMVRPAPPPRNITTYIHQPFAD